MVTRSLITFLPGAHNSDREEIPFHIARQEPTCNTMNITASQKKWLITLAPWLFVFLWSQGLSQPNLPCSTARRFIFYSCVAHF
ncbi:TPA: hypothetical protein ACS26F_003351, partial [Serratia marcescens]